jgi:hypothetical protein
VRRNHLIRSALLLVAAALVFAGLTSAQGQKNLITVLNPAIESKMVDRVPLSPRLDTLEGKTLYLVDINWGGPDAASGVFREMQAWFAERVPSLKIVIKKKAGMYSTDDKPLWAEIKKNANAAMIGISG